MKRAVDTERRAGRFILTGSVRSDVDPVLWPGTGRLIRIAMHPMTVSEQLAVRSRFFVSGLLACEPMSLPSDRPDLRGYVEIALRGGFPEPAIELTGRVRDGWFDSYLDQLLTHERATGRNSRDRLRLAEFFQAYALNSAGVVKEKTLYQAAGLDRRTSLAYAGLLGDLGVIAEFPAWNSNRLKRLARGSKRYVADTGLWGSAVSVDSGSVTRPSLWLRSGY
ncbi:MAG: hypothetical protein OXI96_00535 [Acidimicrobiaceae bacterium]|nr:hypothetical protein [Acidimicrobiaceae bacterium]